MRSNTTANYAYPMTSAFAAPASCDTAYNLISLHTLNVQLGVLLLSVLRLSIGLIRLLILPKTSLNRI